MQYFLFEKRLFVVTRSPLAPKLIRMNDNYWRQWNYQTSLLSQALNVVIFKGGMRNIHPKQKKIRFSGLHALLFSAKQRSQQHHLYLTYMTYKGTVYV